MKEVKSIDQNNRLNISKQLKKRFTISALIPSDEKIRFKRRNFDQNWSQSNKERWARSISFNSHFNRKFKILFIKASIVFQYVLWGIGISAPQSAKSSHLYSQHSFLKTLVLSIILLVLSYDSVLWTYAV